MRRRGRRVRRLAHARGGRDGARCACLPAAPAGQRRREAPGAWQGPVLVHARPPGGRGGRPDRLPSGRVVVSRRAQCGDDSEGPRLDARRGRRVRGRAAAAARPRHARRPGPQGARPGRAAAPGRPSGACGGVEAVRRGRRRRLVRGAHRLHRRGRRRGHAAEHAAPASGATCSALACGPAASGLATRCGSRPGMPCTAGHGRDRLAAGGGPRLDVAFEPAKRDFVGRAALRGTSASGACAGSSASSCSIAASSGRLTRRSFAATGKSAKLPRAASPPPSIAPSPWPGSRHDLGDRCAWSPWQAPVAAVVVPPFVRNGQVLVRV